MFDSLLELRQEEVIARDRTHGLSSEERRELWTISKELAKKKMKDNILHVVSKQ